MVAPLASGSTWILPLLLLHFISFQLLFSSPMNQRNQTKEMMHEFQRTVSMVEGEVKNCPESCHTAHRETGRCSCFNFSVSPQECEFPEYFIKGLSSMHNSTTSLFDIKLLIKMINVTARHINVTFNYCSPGENNTRLMSPKSFIEALRIMTEQLNTYQNSKH